MFDRKKILEGIERTRKEKAQSYATDKEALFSAVRKAVEQMQIMGVYDIDFIPDYQTPEYNALTRYLIAESSPSNDVINAEFKEHVAKPFHAQLKIDEIGVLIHREGAMSFRPIISVAVTKDLPRDEESVPTL